MARVTAKLSQQLHLSGNLGDGMHAVDTDTICIGGVIARGATEVATGKHTASALATRAETAKHLGGSLDMGGKGRVASREG